MRDGIVLLGEGVRESGDEMLLETRFGRLSLPPADVEHHIYHPLARPVIGVLAAALRFVHREAAGIDKLSADFSLAKPGIMASFQVPVHVINPVLRCSGQLVRMAIHGQPFNFHTSEAMLFSRATKF